MTFRVVRSTNWAPSASSSAANAPERAGWLVPMALAAALKCRCSATATKARSWATLGVRPFFFCRGVCDWVLIALSDQMYRV